MSFFRESSFPTYVDVLDYLDAYAKHFDLVNFIKFNHKVLEVRFIGDGQVSHMRDLGAYDNLLPGKPVWEVAVKTGGGDIQWHAFEYFVVVCTGIYGDVPRIPAFPVKKGPEIFKGKVLHSMDYSKLHKEKAYLLLRGKNVAMIGFKKSATDLALESALADQGEERENMHTGGEVLCEIVRMITKSSLSGQVSYASI